MHVIGYARVSTEEQATEGVSLDAQRDRIEAWAQNEGHGQAHVLSDDGVSSGKAMDKRTSLMAALEQVKAVKGVFVVYSMSRMCRSVKEAIFIIESLHAAGAQFVSLNERIDTTTAMGEAFFIIVATFHQLERKMIIERTRAAMAHKRSKGEFLGNAPFGYRLLAKGPKEASMLVPDENEQRGISIIRTILAQTLPGTKPPYGKIARALNEASPPIRPRYAYVPIEDPSGTGRTRRKRVAAPPDARWDRGTARRIVDALVNKGDQPAAQQTLAA